MKKLKQRIRGTLIIFSILFSVFTKDVTAQGCRCTLPSYGCFFSNRGCVMGCAYYCHSPTCQGAATISASDSLVFCTGDSVTLTAYRSGASSYQWMDSSMIIAGATSQTYVAHTAGNYFCKIANSCGTKTAGASVIAETTPIVTLGASGSLSFCTGDSVVLTANEAGYLYQWKIDGVNIVDATSQTYVAKIAGTYSCKVTNSCGSVMSTGIVITVPCLLSNANFEIKLEQLSVYPNPANDFLIVKFPSEEAGAIQIVKDLLRSSNPQIGGDSRWGQ